MLALIAGLLSLFLVLKLRSVEHKRLSSLTAPYIDSIKIGSSQIKFVSSPLNSYGFKRYGDDLFVEADLRNDLSVLTGAYHATHSRLGNLSLLVEVMHIPCLVAIFFEAIVTKEILAVIGGLLVVGILLAASRRLFREEVIQTMLETLPARKTQEIEDYLNRLD